MVAARSPALENIHVWEMCCAFQVGEARVWPVFRPLNQTFTNWVLVNVTDFLIHHTVGQECLRMKPRSPDPVSMRLSTIEAVSLEYPQVGSLLRIGQVVYELTSGKGQETPNVP